LSRTDEEIQIVFDRYKASLYRLYNRELRKDPTLRGQMVLRLTIEPDGSVSMCALQSSDMNAPELSAQLVDRVRHDQFRREGRGGDDDRVPDRLPARGLTPRLHWHNNQETAMARLRTSPTDSRQSDFDKGKTTERWRRKVTGLTGT
jgi:hypothetical protein